MFELKKIAMQIGIPESLFQRYCAVVGAKDKLSKQQATELACLMFFPTANIEPEEVIGRLRECTVNMHYFPKMMSPDGSKSLFRGGLAQYFVDDEWRKTRRLGPQDAPLRRLNSDLFPGDEKNELSLLIAIGEVLHNCEELISRSGQKDPTLMASYVEYTPDNNRGQINFIKSHFDDVQHRHEAIRGESGYPELEVELDFGGLSDDEPLVQRRIIVPFTTIRHVGRAMISFGATNRA
jgi:hypothetical protein